MKLEKFKESALDALKLVVLGCLVGAGVRAAEWTLPAPEMRVIVCTADNIYRIEKCKSAADLIKHGSR